MSDVTLSYKGSDILELSDSGSATLKTGGTYCEADIELEYVKPSGGGSGIVFTTYTGTITLSDTQIGNNELIIPVDTSDARIVSWVLSIKRTGTVANGVVTYDDSPTYDSPISQYLIYGHGGYIDLDDISPKQVTVKYQSDVNAETYTVKSSNTRYRVGYTGSRGIDVNINQSNENVFRANGIKLEIQNAYYCFCRTGYYMEFDYTVRIGKETT